MNTEAQHQGNRENLVADTSLRRLCNEVVLVTSDANEFTRNALKDRHGISCERTKDGFVMSVAGNEFRIAADQSSVSAKVESPGTARASFEKFVRAMKDAIANIMNPPLHESSF